MIDTVKADVSVVITDNKRVIIWVNDQFSQMTGYTLEEVRGKKPALLQGRNTERPAVTRIREALNKKVHFHDRITNYRKNGEEYTCALTIHPIFDLDGTLSNFVAFEVDNNFITPNKTPLMRLSSAQKKNYLTNSEELVLYFKLLDLFRTKKLYLDSNLSQHKVAELMGTNVKYLSQMINNQTEQNFKYFVNQFRVQEFERLLSTKTLQHLTLFSIGEQCGFKNKSTFYNVILNHTGKTPKAIALTYL
jgi:PAS domain S-box-containing protein